MTIRVNQETGEYYDDAGLEDLSFRDPSAPLTPAVMGGYPAVMSTNDWWNQRMQAIGTAADQALTRIANSVAAPGGVLSSNVKNYPPGQFGLNPSAAGVAGGVPQPFLSAGYLRQNIGIVVALAFGAALLIFLSKR